MDPFMSNQDEFSAPETVKTPDGTRSSGKLKRSKVKLVTLGVAAGAFTAIEIGSASAAEVSRTATVSVSVSVKSPGPLCPEVDPAAVSCFATEVDRETEKEGQAKLDANVQGSPGVRRPPTGQPNPQA